jgi:hypothetical protein
MIMGTNRRTCDAPMRQGSLLPGLANVDGIPSRRNTVMSALHGETRVTHEYQSDSSSKPPMSVCRFLPPAWVLPHRPQPEAMNGGVY